MGEELIENQPSNIVGQRVKEARLKVKPSMTQVDLVARLHMLEFFQLDQAKISRIEQGTRPVRDYELLALAEALDVSADWLLGKK